MDSSTYHSTTLRSTGDETFEDGDTTFPSLGGIFRAHKERTQPIVKLVSELL